VVLPFHCYYTISEVATSFAASTMGILHDLIFDILYATAALSTGTKLLGMNFLLGMMKE